MEIITGFIPPVKEKPVEVEKPLQADLNKGEEVKEPVKRGRKAKDGK